MGSVAVRNIEFQQVGYYGQSIGEQFAEVTSCTARQPSPEELMKQAEEKLKAYEAYKRQHQVKTVISLAEGLFIHAGGNLTPERAFRLSQDFLTVANEFSQETSSAAPSEAKAA